MSVVNRETIENLINQTSDINISIFVPTHVRGEEGKQDPIRLKNILQKVKSELQQKGWKENRVEDLFIGVYDLLDEKQFWLHQDRGLALYLNEDHFEYFKIPTTPQEDYYIAENFLITPVLTLQNHHEVYHILVVSQGGTRLLKASSDELSEIELEDVPTTMEEHLKYHEFEPSLQHHMGTNRNQAGFHGQGGETDQDKELELFLKHIESKVTKYLKKVNGPLVLAGLDKVVAMYKKTNHYQNVMDEYLVGNVDNKSGRELNVEAWQKVEPYFRKEIDNSIERFNNLNGNGTASTDVIEIVKGAYFGKVDTLFVPMGRKQWGKFNPDENQVHLTETPTSETVDLINFTAISALRNGSTLYGLHPDEMPHSSNLAAIYRYKT
ncbi:MAG: hypothetical protein WD016_05770 [Balneolaceae bacterium]